MVTWLLELLLVRATDSVARETSSIATIVPSTTPGMWFNQLEHMHTGWGHDLGFFIKRFPYQNCMYHKTGSVRFSMNLSNVQRLISLLILAESNVWLPHHSRIEIHLVHEHKYTYHQTSNISRTLVGNTIVDHSDVVGASPVGTAPTTSSFST